jgi:RimJ/RimL family protein N-acetyltransferase
LISDAPTLRTGRLVLRAHAMTDFAALHALWCDPAVTRFITGRPATQEESWSRLLRYRGHWAMLGFGYWAVIDAESGQFMGEAGFADYHRDMPGLENTAELGWVLASPFHGQGYAFEALAAMLRWGTINLRNRSIRSIIDPGNVASTRLAAKLGFIKTAETRYKESPILLFDWQG